jgi:hypothetical protein
MSQIIIAWDEGPYADRLRDETKGDVSVATSRDDLKNELQDEEGRYRDDVRLIVLLEMSWEERRSRFHGFDLLRDLMLDKDGFDGPVVFCSFAERTSLYDLQSIGRIMAPMPFPFVRLPATPETLVEQARGAKPFSGALLAFVRDNFLIEKPYGICAHQIGGAIEKSDEELQAAVKDALEDLDALSLRLPEELTKHRRAAEQALDEKRYSEARHELKVFVGLLRQRGTHSEGEEDDALEEEEQLKHDIILIEDEKDQLNYYRRGLERDFDVFTAQRASEVLDELEENPDDREYLAIVADWWLKKEDGKTWQPMQGFELLDRVGRKHGLIHRVALTSLPPGAFASVRNAAPSSIMDDYFPKGSLGNTRAHSFPQIAAKIEEGIAERLRVRDRLPQKGRWNEVKDEAKQKGGKNFTDLFIALRCSPRWDEEREDIEQHSKEILETYKEHYDDKYAQGQAVREITQAPHHLSLGGRGAPADEDTIRKALKLRLITIGLYLERDLEDKDIHRLLHGRSSSEDAASTIKHYYPDIGLSRTSGKLKLDCIFPYEYEWMQREFGFTSKKLEGSTLTGDEAEYVKYVKNAADNLRTFSGINVTPRPSIDSVDAAADALLNVGKQIEKDSATLAQKLLEIVETTFENEDYFGVVNDADRNGELDKLKDTLESIVSA